MSARNQPLWLFYDGTCRMCSTAVAWALRRDRFHRLRPISAQSAEAAEMLGPVSSERILEELHAWSPDEGVTRGPRAVAAILRRLPGWSSAGAMIGSRALLPITEPAYRWVARRRRWFGAPTCTLPIATPANRARPGSPP